MRKRENRDKDKLNLLYIAIFIFRQIFRFLFFLKSTYNKMVTKTVKDQHNEDNDE